MLFSVSMQLFSGVSGINNEQQFVVERAPLVGVVHIKRNNKPWSNGIDNKQKISKHSGLDRSVDGFASDKRFYYQSREWEAGLSGVNGQKSGSAGVIGNVYRTWQHSEGSLTDTLTRFAVDFGVFSKRKKNSADARLRLNHSLKPLSFLRVNFDGNYSGINFRSHGKSVSGKHLSRDQIKSSLSLNFRLPYNSVVNVYGNWSQHGVRSHYTGNTARYGAKLFVQPFTLAPRTTVNYTRTLRKKQSKDFEAANEIVSILAKQNFKWLRYSTRFEYEISTQEQLTSVFVSHKTLEYHFSKQAVVNANATISSVWSGASNGGAKLGGRVHADSGYLLGENWKLGTDYTHRQSVPTLLVKGKKLNTRVSSSLSVFSRYRISRNFELGMTYKHDFKQQHILQLSLKGHFGVDHAKSYKR